MDTASLWRRLPERFRLPARQPPCPLGLELATEKLHLVQMEGRPGSLAMRSAVSVPLPCPREDLLARPDRFRDLVRGALAKGSFSGRQVVSCPPAGSLRIVPIDFTPASGQSEGEAVMKTLQDRLHDDMGDAVVDFLPIRADAAGPAPRAAIAAVARRADVVAYLRLLESAGLEPLALDIGPAALARLAAALDTTGERPNVLLVNFGRKRTFLTVVWGRRLMLDREVEFGEDRIVAALERNLGVEPAIARSMLYGNGFTLEPRRPGDTAHNFAAAITEILRPDFAALAQEVNRTLIYVASQTHGNSIRHIYLLGSVARYPGAAEFLGRLFEVPVEALNPLSAFQLRHGSAADLEPVAGIAVATGLALRGVVDRA